MRLFANIKIGDFGQGLVVYRQLGGVDVVIVCKHWVFLLAAGAAFVLERRVDGSPARHMGPEATALECTLDAGLLTGPCGLADQALAVFRRNSLTAVGAIRIVVEPVFDAWCMKDMIALEL